MRLIRLKEVMDQTALSRSAIYRKMKAGEFPQSVSLGDRAVAWVESEVQEWILEKVSQGHRGLYSYGTKESYF
ncbi:AlpA family transcriptional regulator [Vibrio parahaemolyticus]|uniref:AlpA family transcriptional regulator n=1 Tax=Vibrio parahaemolyticus TaxID=670 RepID=UPI001FAE677B|nr:AlpA family transcriptional regulator [Vibrio parahaemolyticus]MCI9689792.1 AlpA family transcriptional regulator [Vibrio parahaemolyticus]